MGYIFELGLALLTLAAVLIAAASTERAGPRLSDRTDFITVGLLFPGVVLLCAVLGAWADSMVDRGAMDRLGADRLDRADHRRDRVSSIGGANPLLMTRWHQPMGRSSRIAVIAFLHPDRRWPNKAFGSVGLLSSLGMGVDQFQTLYIIVTLAALAGLVTAIFASSRNIPPGRSR